MTLPDEYGQDQVVCGQARLTHEASREVVATGAAHASRGKSPEWKRHRCEPEKGGNFSMGEGSYRMKGLTALPRFSSLSGRLNPN
jgi:hypothetical protein